MTADMTTSVQHLDNLTSSLTSALSSLPETSSLVSPADGISLLDLKSELFLSYLQHLVFLIIHKLQRAGARARSSDGIANGRSDNGEHDNDSLNEKVVKRLVESRIYLERGVRPLEGRLKYQLDKILRAADDATAEHEAAEVKGTVTAKIDDLSYRPNPSSLLRPAQQSSTYKPTINNNADKNGIYRPPRITPISLPNTTPNLASRKESRRPMKSATLDEFITTELSNAPLAEPSIGSTIVSGGRRNKTQRERQTDSDRRDYEESNFVRLPKESKKERAKQIKAAGGRDSRRGGYGGEEWRGLGEGVDRIERLTARKSESGARSLLERSRKRKANNGGGGDGGEDMKFGERLERKRRMLGTRNRSKADYQ